MQLRQGLLPFAQHVENVEQQYHIHTSIGQPGLTTGQNSLHIRQVLVLRQLLHLTHRQGMNIQRVDRTRRADPLGKRRFISPRAAPVVQDRVTWSDLDLVQ